MRIIFLYQPNSEHARLMEDYARDFMRIQNSSTPIELLSLDTRDGASMASLYDIVRYPAIVVLGPDGGVQKFWQGSEETPPLMNELAAVSHN